jgi:hypothetical protein
MEGTRVHEVFEIFVRERRLAVSLDRRIELFARNAILDGDK